MQLVPGCDEGSISVVSGRRTVTSEAASGELPRVVDALRGTVVKALAWTPPRLRRVGQAVGARETDGRRVSSSAATRGA